jgi:hypothetical protein
VSSSLKKVSPGDPLVIPAGAYNTFVDAARDYLDRRQDQGQEDHPAARHSGIVPVRIVPHDCCRGWRDGNPATLLR